VRDEQQTNGGVLYSLFVETNGRESKYEEGTAIRMGVIL